MLGLHVVFVNTSKAKFWFSFYISRPSMRQWSLISYVTLRPSARQWSSVFLHQDPLRDNGHWFLMSHRGPLRGNGHWSLHIKTLYETMVIDFLCHIEALYEAMVIDLFTSRLSTRQWSSISLYQDPLWGNGNWFLISYWGPLRDHGHRSLYIKTLCEAMVIVSFTSRPATRQWLSISLHQDPLHDNGHWFLCQIGTLYMVMVTKSLDIDPLHEIGLISFSKSQSYKKIFFRMGPSTW